MIEFTIVIGFLAWVEYEHRREYYWDRQHETFA